jgi:phosphoribosylanthranilate isomerase
MAADGRPVLAVWGPPDLDAILRTRDATGIRGVQLHGGSDPVLATRLREEGLIVWRVLRLAGAGDLSHLDHMMEGADALLIEPRVPGAEGGAGVALDLGIAAEAMGRVRASPDAPRTALAGGLRPDTVRRAIAEVRPDIVDVSSGVERSPGVKDPFLIRRFIAEAIADPTPP